MNPTNNLAKSLQHDRLRVFVRALLCGRRALADDLAHVASAAAAAAVAREKNSSGGGKKKNGGGGMTSRGVASGTTTELFDTCCQLYGRGDGGAHWLSASLCLRMACRKDHVSMKPS